MYIQTERKFNDEQLSEYEKPGTFASDDQIKSLLTIHKAKNISVTKYQN